MKLIEAMKLIKELQIKAEDLRKKVTTYCANMDFETPAYPDQKNQVAEWIQSHGDVLKEVLKLRLQIQKTNILTLVEMELGGVRVTKTIAEWIHRRRDLAGLEMNIWMGLSDKGLKDQFINPSVQGGALTPVKVRRYFDPVERDNKIELYRTEPGVIDRTLEVINAITNLITE